MPFVPYCTRLAVLKLAVVQLTAIPEGPPPAKAMWTCCGAAGRLSDSGRQVAMQIASAFEAGEGCPPSKGKHGMMQSMDWQLVGVPATWFAATVEEMHCCAAAHTLSPLQLLNSVEHEELKQPSQSLGVLHVPWPVGGQVGGSAAAFEPAAPCQPAGARRAAVTTVAAIISSM